MLLELIPCVNLVINSTEQGWGWSPPFVSDFSFCEICVKSKQKLAKGSLQPITFITFF